MKFRYKEGANDLALHSLGRSDDWGPNTGGNDRGGG